MATFFMLGRYSAEAVKGISAKRTEKAENLIKQFNGEVKSAYALLGEFDLAIIARFSTIQDAMSASLAMAKGFGISFTTLPAVSVEEFDKLASEV
jgi:uncharacterized protein with GYD domain